MQQSPNSGSAEMSPGHSKLSRKSNNKKAMQYAKSAPGPVYINESRSTTAVAVAWLIAVFR